MEQSKVREELFQVLEILNQSAIFGFNNEFIGYYKPNRATGHNWALVVLSDLKDKGAVTDVGFQLILFLYRSMKAFYEDPRDAILMEIANIKSIDDLRSFPEFMDDNGYESPDTLEDIAEFELCHAYDPDEAERLLDLIQSLTLESDFKYGPFFITMEIIKASPILGGVNTPMMDPLTGYKVRSILTDAEDGFSGELLLETTSIIELHSWLLQQ